MILYPFLYLFLPFLFVLVPTIIMTVLGHSKEYIISVVDSYNLLIVVLLFGILFPLVLKKYKGDDGTFKFGFYLFYGLFLNVIYNLILYFIDKSIFVFEVDFLVLFYGSVIIGPILEEYIFRGILYNELKEKFDINKSMIISSLIFALFHQNLVQIIYAFVFGLILAHMYEKYRNLNCVILMHMISNFVSILSFYLVFNFLG